MQWHCSRWFSSLSKGFFGHGGAATGLTTSRNKKKFSKDGPWLPDPHPRILHNLWVSAEGVLRNLLQSRKPVEEPLHTTPKVLQNFESQAQLFRHCKFFSQIFVQIAMSFTLQQSSKFGQEVCGSPSEHFQTTRTRSLLNAI